jgi:hypothetical protein
MLIILVYAPSLLFLPVLLLVGVVFVVVPGGFIVVLGGLYFAATGFAGLLGLAANRRWRPRASRVRSANIGFENTSPSGRASFGPRGAIAPRPVVVGLTSDQTIGSAANVMPSRRGSADVDLVARLDSGRVAGRQDDARDV